MLPLKFDLAEGIDDNGAADESMISPAKAPTKQHAHFHAEGASRTELGCIRLARTNKKSLCSNQPNYFTANDARGVCMEKSINDSLWISFTWLFFKQHSSDFHQLFPALVRGIFLVHCMGTIILASQFNDTKWARQDGVNHKSNSRQGDIFLPFAEKGQRNYR